MIDERSMAMGTRPGMCDGCNKPLFDPGIPPSVMPGAEPILHAGNGISKGVRYMFPQNMQNNAAAGAQSMPQITVNPGGAYISNGTQANAQSGAQAFATPQGTLMGATPQAGDYRLPAPQIGTGVSTEPSGVDFVNFIPGNPISYYYSSQPQPTPQPQARLDSLPYLNGFLRSQLGKLMTVDFMIGSGELVQRTGVLVVVGYNYIVLYDHVEKKYTACDFYDIKFVTALFPQ